MAHSSEGVTRLIKNFRSESKKVSDFNAKNNMLGTITATGIYIDSIEDEVPRSDFLFLTTSLVNDDTEHDACKVRDYKVNDRVLCVPVGEYYVVMGKVE